MKVKVPENIEDITLEQLQKYTLILENEELTSQEIDKHKINIFIGIPFENIDDISATDYTELVMLIDKSLNEPSLFKQRFELNGIEFGFVENLDGMTQGEWNDLEKYQNNVQEYHRLMSILFRPIKRVDRFGNYKVMKYKGTSEHCETMKQMPLSIVNGALVFFSNLANELEQHIHQSITAEQVREVKHLNTSKNGDGMRQLFRLPIFQRRE